MADNPASTDVEQDASAGDPPPIARLVADYHAALYRYAFRLCGSVADAEDLTQQVFLIAQQKLSQIRNAGSTRAWLYAVLRNCFLKLRRRNVPLPAEDLQLDVATIPDRAADADEIDSERLQAALDELPEEFRLVLLMFYFEERSYREIAEQLELPLGTVMSRLSRAKGHLRARLISADSDASPSSAPAYPGLKRPDTTRQST